MTNSILAGTRRLAHSQNSRGFALIVALLLMVALAFIGVSALRNVTLQEKMAGNLYYRTIALHESEAGMRFARQRIESDWLQDTIPAGNSEETLGTWGAVVGTPSLSFFSKAANWSSATTINSLLSSRPVDAQFTVEQFAPPRDILCGSGQQCNFLYVRSSARAVDTLTGAAVVTQEWAKYPK
jgi:Tfp pilus assembly protein PilX